MSIKNEFELPATPHRVFEVLTDSALFSEATGQAATVTNREGEPFSLFGGIFTGRLVESVPNERLVFAWRAKEWELGLYSFVRFVLKARGKATRLTLDHSGYPDGESPLYPTWHEHLSTGWSQYYFGPIAKYLGAIE
jgi:activator of HSP90 ATPase